MTYMYITNFPLDNNKESGTDPCSYSHVVETVGGLEEIKLVDEQSKVDEHVHSLQVRAQQTSVKWFTADLLTFYPKNAGTY